MWRELVIFYAPKMVIILLSAFISLKFIKMMQLRITENYIKVFTWSLLIYTEPQIKNAQRQRMKKFYKASNRINIFFYGVFTIMMLVYLGLESL